MPHYLLQANENQWILVRETPSSQKFKGTTSDGDELGVDVHYTMPKILSTSIAFAGPQTAFVSLCTGIQNLHK
jgi:hypothetical protein